MARRNGNGNQGPELLYDIIGNCAAHICQECGKPYVVSAYANHLYQARDQGWRVCPHCKGTEATIWYVNTVRVGKTKMRRKIYASAQRVLSREERRQVAEAKPVRYSRTLEQRLPHARRVSRINRFA